MLQLEYQKRGEESLDALRATSRVPAVFYGPQEESTQITLSEVDFRIIWKQSGGSSIITLTGELGDKEVLIQDVAMHPVKDKVLHVDFYAIERGKKLTVTVPFNFVGEAPAEKLGGTVVKVMNEVDIRVRPSAIPHELTVDLSILTDLDSVIKISDITLPEGAEAEIEDDAVVVSVAEQKEEVEEEVRDISDVEIAEKGKKEEEAAEE